jgi:ABC-type nitrate/sulfonate/bicarbonate transport system ATPase subunit/ABC-type transporter Mla maintaining outer membrane lipid asymmetry permease subunit MlaE
VTKPCLSIRQLSVERPDGQRLLSEVDLELHAGEVLVLLGGSGAGKSTLGRALFEPQRLRAAGFAVSSEALRLEGQLGLVPQRGALLDHLDVAGNIRLALRYAEPAVEQTREAVEDWLRRVDLDAGLAAPGTPVASLSGGQAQRVAVARTLASGRRILFLDEPSAGLDPARVRLLARQIRRQAEEQNAACVVVTHDVALTTGVADRILLLDSDTGRLVPLLEEDWPGPFDAASPPADDDRATWQARLEQVLVQRLGGATPQASTGKTRRRRGPDRFSRRLLAPFEVAASGLIDGAAQLLARPGDYLAILGRALAQALVRPAPFYAVVSVLLGYTILYVISAVAPMGVPATRAVAFLGSSHIVALVPPVGAFLFVAASGGAVNGWLGGMSLTQQILALEALGIDQRRYLCAPTWLGVGLASLCVSLLFGLGMCVGGYLFCLHQDIADGWGIVTGGFTDPRPERIPYLVRAACLVFVYAWGIAADVVAAGSADKYESDHVTRSMTGSVVRCTLWVVALELVSIAALFALVRG